MLEIHLSNGRVIQEAIDISPDWLAVSFSIRVENYQYVISMNQSSVVYEQIDHTTCGFVQGNSSGKVKLNVYNNQKKCFKLSVNGVSLNQVYASNITFQVDPGNKVLDFIFSNGTKYQVSCTPKADWISAAYRLNYLNNHSNHGSYRFNLDQNSIVKEAKPVAPMVINKTVVVEAKPKPQQNTTVIHHHHTTNPSPTPRPAPSDSKCGNSYISNSQFNAIKSQINGELMSSSKLSLATQLLRNRCMRSFQVAEICEMLMMGNQKLEYAKSAYHHTYDTNNYHLVVNKMFMSFDKDKLRSYMNSY